VEAVVIRHLLDCFALARTVLVLSDRVSELSRRLRAESERADRADRLADYYRAAEDRAIRVAVRAEERARAAEQEELRGREARIGASHGEYALRTGLDHARRRWRDRARGAEEALCAAEHDLAIIQHNHHVRTGEWRMRLSAGLRKKYHAAVRERAVAQYERDEARHELAELRADIAAAEARLRAGRL
jgi:hypothetical protein